LVVLISLCSIFLGREIVEGKIYAQLDSFVGHDTAVQMQQIIKNAFISGKGHLAAVIGVITLLIGATTVFGDIQDSINRIWGIKPKPKRGWLKLLRNRFLSFSIIATLGFLLLVSLGISAIIEALMNSFKAKYPDVAVIFVYIINLVLTLGITALIFAVIFRVLPDARIKWKDVIAGAITTAILFMIGKFGISFYIGKTHVGSTYGTAGSLAILLLWVYYSAIILYFGAEFTKAYAIKYGSAIHPNDYAVTTKQVEVETGKQTIQAKENTEHEVKIKPDSSTAQAKKSN
jgi:membrane protein